MSTPTTFETHGRTWFSHTPGDPMPCDKDALVFILRRKDEKPCDTIAKAFFWCWQTIMPENEIVAWRYAAHPQEKDELTRLRDENATMQTLLGECRNLFNKLDHAKTCSWVMGNMCNCGLAETFAKLSLFTTKSK